jgi:beta-glucosidase-like glycosyl hydrolase
MLIVCHSNQLIGGFFLLVIVNNIPSCASSFLLTEVLRDEWGFDGYVVSDCGAIDCIQNTQYASNDRQKNSICFIEE